MEKFIDFAAAGRIATRVELKDIRITDVLAKCDPRVQGPLEPLLDSECTIVGQEQNLLYIACKYQFTARSSETRIAEAAVNYLLAYEVQGTEALGNEDLAEFANSNSTLHSWPFLREFLYGLTTKMGYPPYMLPVVHFKEKPKETKDANQKTVATPASTVSEPVE